MVCFFSNCCIKVLEQRAAVMSESSVYHYAASDLLNVVYVGQTWLLVKGLLLSKLPSNYILKTIVTIMEADEDLEL